MKADKLILYLTVILALTCPGRVQAQWTTNGANIYNTNTGFVGIGNNSPSMLLYVAKNMTEAAVTVNNLGGIGGATYRMVDNASSADWKFKTTISGGFKIRDHANALDVITIEALSPANAIYVNSNGNIGMWTNTPDVSAALDINSTSKGFLVPRMTPVQINSVSAPADGLSVYNTTDNHFYAYNTSSTSWNRVAFDAETITPFQCGQSYTDERDSHIYNTVQIGSQCWMKSNLNYGSMIPASQSQSDNQVFEKYCYDDNQSGCDTWGGLYQWGEMMNYGSQQGAQGICPVGWHVPSDGEWCTLATFLDATVTCQGNVWSGTDAGGKMKETGTTHWWDPNNGATNSSGFTGIAGGFEDSGGFYFLMNVGHWWSSSTVGSNHPLWMLRYQSADIGRWEHPSYLGFSVRCIKD